MAAVFLYLMLLVVFFYFFSSRLFYFDLTTVSALWIRTAFLWLSQMAMNEFYASMIMIALDVLLFPVL